MSTPTTRPATAGARLAAFTLDAVAVTALGAGVGIAASSAVLGLLVAVEACVALLVWEARTGLTVGNAALGLRTVQDGAPCSPGTGRELARFVVLATGALVAGAGAWVVAASGAFDATRRGRTWADKAAGTAVLVVARRAQAAGAGALPHPLPRPPPPHPARSARSCPPGAPRRHRSARLQVARSPTGTSGSRRRPCSLRPPGTRSPRTSSARSPTPRCTATSRSPWLGPGARAPHRSCSRSTPGSASTCHGA
ncbi:hypothetical protein ET495_01575 [Xylanimonas allomyrinae]|uniref:RDD domain-containing protein n=1 Tax=Xylanimonas allomyrinae TaxID=2509459 RepID=A0A4V0YDX0_9MICO|nr:hypothetical protein ET495_01575 [Xylanimonas allomyrinae]